MQFLLAGDHSDYHCGSAAVTQVILAELRRHGEVVTGGAYDMLVVNGEGSMHHGGGGFRSKMQQIAAALRDGKRATLINTVWQDNPHDFDDALVGCERVIARETLSAQALRGHGVAAEVLPDLSYFAPVAAAETRDFAGKVVATDFFSAEFGCFVKLRSRWAERLEFVDMRAMNWSSLVRSLKTASLLITGRHHGMYAACRAGIPFLAMRGNTHKIEGLMESAGAAIPVFGQFQDLRDAIDRHADWRKEYDRLFDWLERQPRWQLQ